MSLTVLILYDRKGATIESLASSAAEGVANSGLGNPTVKRIEEAHRSDLLECDALMLGSPNWSGITGTMKTWLDEQGDLWEEGQLTGKPAAAFTSGWGRHSGTEMTLLQLIHWLLACGMVVVGLPWSDRMRVSGSYYGASATAGLSDVDLLQAQELGLRLTTVAARLKDH